MALSACDSILRIISNTCRRQSTRLTVLVVPMIAVGLRTALVLWAATVVTLNSISLGPSGFGSLALCANTSLSEQVSCVGLTEERGSHTAWASLLSRTGPLVRLPRVVAAGLRAVVEPGPGVNYHPG